MHVKVPAAVRVWLKILGGGLGLAVFMVYGSGALHRKARGAGAGAEAQPGLPLDPGAARHTVASAPHAPGVDVVGTTASAEMIHLSARLSAYVKQVNVTAGQRVRRGEVLLALDDREIQEQVLAAEAQLQLAEAEFKRTQQLFAQHAATEQALTAASSGFHAARAQAERARVMRSYAEVTAPIDGVVTDRRVEAGDLANPGQVLLAVYDPVRMRLEAPVPVRLVERLALGQDVAVDLERPAGRLKGRVAQIVGAIDPSSRTQLVKVDLEGADGRILPGTFGRLWVQDAARPAIFVPESAVYRAGQIEMVQVVRGGRVLRRAVQTGVREAARVEILAGLRPGDEILVHPAPAAGAEW